MMYLAPYWHPPTVGIPDFSIALPAQVAVSLGLLWLATLILSLAGILWAAVRASREGALGMREEDKPRRRHRGSRNRPALYPV